MKSIHPLLPILALLGTVACGPEHDHGAHQEREAEATAAADPAPRAAFYPLATCLVSGEALGSTPTERVIEGRLVRTCCEDCADEIAGAPQEWLARLDQAAIAAQLARYPLDTCPISEEPIDSMGGPLDVVIAGRLVRFCCEGCVKPFEKKAEKYFADIDQAMIEAQRADYPHASCPVSGEPLGSMGEPFELLHGDRLVRLCCASCEETFASSPTRWLAELDAAPSDAAEDAAGGR